MSIVIKSDKILKKQHNFWNNIHFHPTDAIEDEWGRRILDQVKEDNVADTVRMYAMLEDIVSMDENGNLVYDFTDNDTRLDYMVGKGFNILLSYNFLPACIVSDHEIENLNRGRYKGKHLETAQVKDYALWEEICREYTKHIIERYGEDTVSKWYLQCFNEPDIRHYFLKGLDHHLPTAEVDEIRRREYMKLYTAFAKGVLSVSENVKIGGPAGAMPPMVEAFVKYTLENNIRVDYLCAHTYGTNPDMLNSGEREINVENNRFMVSEYTDIIEKYYPEGKELIVDEWGAAGCGFYDKTRCPKLMFRENEVFAAFFANLITTYIYRDMKLAKTMICLSGQHQMTEDFTGYRSFFTLNFIKKPIYNMYVLARKIKENILASENAPENLSVLPTRDDNGNHTLLFTYATPQYDGDLPDMSKTVEINGVSGEKTVREWRIDSTHTNPYNLSLRNGYPIELTPEQIQILKEEGTLKPVREYTVNADGKLTLDLDFVNNGVLVVEF